MGAAQQKKLGSGFGMKSEPAEVLAGIDLQGKVRAQVKEIETGAPVSIVPLSSTYIPVDAIALTGAAGTGRNEIAVLGRNANGEYQLIVKDVLTGSTVKKTSF